MDVQLYSMIEGSFYRWLRRFKERKKKEERREFLRCLYRIILDFRILPRWVVFDPSFLGFGRDEENKEGFHGLVDLLALAKKILGEENLVLERKNCLI